MLAAFLYGLTIGIVAHEWSPSVSEVLGVALLFVLCVMIDLLVVVAGLRGVSALALTGALFGAMIGAGFILGHFFTVVVTDRTLTDYGGDEGWESLLTFALTLWVTAGALLGFVSAWVIRMVAWACSWLIEHAPRPTPNHHSPA
jgi:hypothetical protein